MFVILVSVSLASASAAAEASEPRIVVAGVGAVQSAPDLAELSYDVLGEGKTSDQAVTALVAKSRSIEEALRSLDPDLKIASEKVKVQAVRGPSCQKDEDYDDRVTLSTGPCAIVGFVAQQDFDLTTSRVMDAGTMVGLAARQGAANPKIDEFSLANTDEARRQAIGKALADARSKAEAIALANGSKLGPAMNVALDGAGFGREQEIVVTGSRIKSSGNRPVIVKVAPGSIWTRAEVTVSYAVAR